MDYLDYDVPENLRFRTLDIVRMKGLECTAKLAPKDFNNILSEPDKILSVNVKLSFSISNKDIFVHGELDGQIRARCGRCLEFFETPFHEEFDQVYSVSSEIIDIMYEVVQTLALIENIAFICKSDCKGLCGQCGKNRNITACGCKEENFSPFAALKKDKKI